MKKINIDHTLLLQALVSLCRDEADNYSKDIVRKWLSEDSANEKVLECLMHTSFIGDVDESEETRDMLFLRIMNRIRESEQNSRCYRSSIRDLNQKSKHSIISYASVVAVILVFILGGIYLLFTPEKEIVVFGKEGEIVELTLDDGSTVDLNSGSMIAYPITFKGKERRVKLEGEAYFEVVGNEKQPFIVELDQAEVGVLGTRFNVKAYKEDEKIITTLLEGIVQFRLKDVKDESLILQPNQQIVYDLSTSTHILSEVEADIYTTWREGGLYFENVDLDEITRILERRFGVAVENQTTSQKGQYFSGMFEKETGLLQILDVLKRHRTFDYENKNGKIRLFDI